MSTIITIGVVDQVLTLIGTPVVSSGGKNEDYVSFTFDETWNGFAKIAVFYRQTKEIYYALVDDNNVAVVPPEVIATSGIMYLGVVGVNDDTTITKTSQVLPYRIVGGALDGFKPEPATPDVFEQMLALAQEMRDLAEEIKQRQIDFEADINEQWEAYKTAMNQAESERVEAEIDRTEAESARVTAEGLRVEAENGRVTAENARVSAENTRVSQENARVSAENARVEAENGRVTAENGRVSAESTRVSEWQGLKTEIEQTLQSGALPYLGSLKSDLGITDLNDAITQGTCIVKEYADGYLNLPDSVDNKGNGSLIVFTLINSGGFFQSCVQIYVLYTGDTYIRSKWYEKWRPWVAFEIDGLEALETKINSLGLIESVEITVDVGGSTLSPMATFTGKDYSGDDYTVVLSIPKTTTAEQMKEISKSMMIISSVGLVGSDTWVVTKSLSGKSNTVAFKLLVSVYRTGVAS